MGTDGQARHIGHLVQVAVDGLQLVVGVQVRAKVQLSVDFLRGRLDFWGGHRTAAAAILAQLHEHVGVGLQVDVGAEQIVP